MRRARHSDRGAAAVEFALVLPLLLTLIIGVLDLGEALNAQALITDAARESVRALVLSSGTPQAVCVGVQAAGAYSSDIQWDAGAGVSCTGGADTGSPVVCPAPGVAITTSCMTPCPSPNPGGANAEVILHATVPYLIPGYIPGLGTSINVTGQAVMTCP